MSAMVGQLPQDLEIHPVHPAWATTMAGDDVVQRKIGHRGPRRRAGLLAVARGAVAMP